jgi:regulatory protein
MGAGEVRLPPPQEQAQPPQNRPGVGAWVALPAIRRLAQTRSKTRIISEHPKALSREVWPLWHAARSRLSCPSSELFLPPTDSSDPEPSSATPDAITPAAFHEAALDYLARYAASTARLRRVLERRLRRRTADRDALEAARTIIAEVIEKLTAQGFLEDGRYASVKAESLVRQGRSRRWIEAKLSADGVAPALIQSALKNLSEGNANAELVAAIAFARRRRLGPYRTSKRGSQVEPKKLAEREMAAFARAGFDRRTTRIVLEAGSPEALAALLASLQD